jgi:hypothetical protein
MWNHTHIFHSPRQLQFQHRLHCICLLLEATFPEAHTLFMVVQATGNLNPANIAACLAGACPTPA